MLLRIFSRTLRRASTFEALVDGGLAAVVSSAVAVQSEMQGAVAQAWRDAFTLTGMPVAAIVVGLHFGLGTYRRQRTHDNMLLRMCGVHALGASVAALSIVARSSAGGASFAALALVVCALSLVVVLSFRFVLSWWRSRSGETRVLIVGGGAEGPSIVEAIHSDAVGARHAVGYYGAPPEGHTGDHGAPVFDLNRELWSVIRQFDVSEVVLTSEAGSNLQQLQQDLFARDLGHVTVLTGAQFVDRYRTESTWDTQWADDSLAQWLPDTAGRRRD